MENQEERIPIPKLKRLFDVVFALILLIITMPLFVLILVAIFIEHIFRKQMFAPLFYKETRITQGEPFNFIKFNIFKPRIIAKIKREGKFIHSKTLEKDKNSLTVVGQIIQKVYLDELPQIFNILRGNMSVVGPRPVNLENYKRVLTQGITTKTIMKAGFTGNYQSHKGEPGMGQEDLDRAYINFCLNNPSWKIVLLDIKIILRTILIIFRAQGI